MYEEQRATWRTPKGNTATFVYRADTSDWNTVQSCTTEDEYGLRNLELTGWALDIGAHIGGVTIALAVDNPGLHVTAVEAVEENWRLLRRNSEINGIQDRVWRILGAASDGSDAVMVAYGYSDTENGRHHAFIGNTGIVGPETHKEKLVGGWSLRDLLIGFPDPPSLVKIDCEGCEWKFLTDPLVATLPLIIGEWHPLPGGHNRDDLLALLGDSHEVTFTGPEGGPGGFRAVKR